MKFRIYLTQTILFETEDETEQGAIKWAETHPELGKVEKASATAICKIRDMEEGEDGDDEADHKEVEGHCEMCDKPILQGDDYSVAGEDRYYLCPPCAEAGKEAFRKAVTKGLCGYCGLNALMPGKDHCEDCTPED